MTTNALKSLNQFKQYLQNAHFPNEYHLKILEDYKQTGSMTITALHFGITRQRVHQIIKRFGYKKERESK